MKCFPIVMIVASALFLAACNGGGSRRVVGRQCAPDHTPFTMTLAPGQTEVSLNPNAPADTKFQAGQYSYMGSSVYYIDKGTDFRIEVIEALDSKTNKMKLAPGCARNARGDLNITFSAAGVGKMQVEQDFKTIVDIRSYGFTTQNGSFKPVVTDTNQKVDAVEKAYTTGSPQIFAVKKSDVDFEIRTINEDAKGKYFLIVHLKKGPLSK